MRSAQELMPYETWFGFRNSGFNSENFFRWEGCKLPIPFIIVALLAERGGKRHRSIGPTQLAFIQQHHQHTQSQGRLI